MFHPQKETGLRCGLRGAAFALLLALLGGAIPAQAFDAPDYYGLYALVGDELIEVKEQSTIDLDLPSNVSFIAFDRSVATITPRAKLQRRVFVRNIHYRKDDPSLTLFGMAGKDQRYRKWTDDYSLTAPELRVGPVPQQSEMVRVVPTESLEPGVYDIEVGALSGTFFVDKDRVLSDLETGPNCFDVLHSSATGGALGLGDPAAGGRAQPCAGRTEGGERIRRRQAATDPQAEAGSGRWQWQDAADPERLIAELGSMDPVRFAGPTESCTWRLLMSGADVNGEFRIRREHRGTRRFSGEPWEAFELITTQVDGTVVNRMDVWSRATTEGLFERTTEEGPTLSLPWPPRLGAQWRIEKKDGAQTCRILGIGTLQLDGRTLESALKTECTGHATMGKGRNAVDQFRSTTSFVVPEVGLVVWDGVFGPNSQVGILQLD